ncbi:hypothetical protein EDD86DRAFT_253319 [Gorgonomyces haynaldii]|nr:hypothetical protein EDD86DRAFT_253319 [Gorgonomyces haynaldii]
MDYQDSDGNLLELPEASEESSMDQGSQSESEAPLESEQEDIHPESTRDETDSPEKTTLIPTDALETQTESTGLSLIESTQQKQSNDLMAGSLFSESQIMPLLSGNFSASLYSGSLPSAKPDPQSESLLQGSLKDSFKSSERMSLGEDIGDYLSGAFSSNTNEQSTDRPSAHRESQRQSQFTLSETVEHSLVRESVDHSLVRDTEERKVEKSKFIEYEAEIEEDEFMHLGGVDGEDFMGIDEYEKDMLQDGKQLLETDQQAIKSILEDVTSGAYRKRRRRIDPDGKGLDLYDSDEENEALLRQIRKRMGLSIRKKKEIEDPIERLAADPKTAAFANCFSRAEKESMLSEGSEDELQKPMLKPDSDHESQSTEQSFSQGSDILSRILERRTKMKPSAPAQKTNPILFQHANRLLSKKSLLTVVESQESNADKITKSSMVFKSLVQTETKTVVQRKPKTDHKLRKIISKRTE